jgi:hypothetical protein
VADQVTVMFEDPITVAVKGWVVPVCTDAEGGLIATVRAGGGFLGLEEDEPRVPAQPATPSIAKEIQEIVAIDEDRRSLRVCMGFRFLHENSGFASWAATGRKDGFGTVREAAHFRRRVLK